MPKEYPAEFKAKIIKRYQKGESIQSLSQELHIAQSTLYDWKREYCSIKTANRTYMPKEFGTISNHFRFSFTCYLRTHMVQQIFCAYALRFSRDNDLLQPRLSVL